LERNYPVLVNPEEEDNEINVIRVIKPALKSSPAKNNDTLRQVETSLDWNSE